MKFFWCTFLLSLVIFAGCVPGKSNLAISINKKSDRSISSASVSSVQIINNQLIINGVSLSKVSNVKVSGHSLNEIFSIESQTATKIIANSARAFSFDVSKVFSLILSDANASATFQIDFSLCNATLGGAGFDCKAPANNDVLVYDQTSNTWMPRALAGISYKGTWDANTAEPAATIVGQYYIVNVANPPTYEIGDWIVWDGSAYDVIAQSAAGKVSTVFGRPGMVVAVKGDYSLDLLGDVDIPTPTAGQVLKFDGAKWVADADIAGASGGAGSVTTTELADGSVTNIKIANVAASKITGTITSAQVADGAIVNADINAAAAIDYSKLNIPAASIPYAKLSIADGDIPAAKISGLPAGTAVLATAITDGDTTHAPDGNVVFDTLATKLDKTGGTILTILNVPTPVLGTEATTKDYVDTAVNLRLLKAGGTMSGILTLDSDLKIKGGSNYVTLRGHATSDAYSLILPADDGDNNQVLTTNGSGVLSWTTPASGAVALTGDVGGTSAATAIGTGKVTATHILDGTIINADINAAAAIDYSKLNVPAAAIPLTALNATGTKDATKYLKGDNTWATLTTDVLGTELSGLTLTNAAITASDTVISAFGKLQKQVTDYSGATMSGDLTGTLPSPTVSKIKGVTVSATAPADGQFFKYTTAGTNWVPSFVTATDLKSTALGNLFPGTGCAANQTLYYSVVGDSFSCANINTLDGDKITTGTIAAARLPASASYWASATGGINYAGGNVGIGIIGPTSKLEVDGQISSNTGGYKFPDGSIQLKAAVEGGTGGINFQILAANKTLTTSDPIYQFLDPNGTNRNVDLPTVSVNSGHHFILKHTGDYSNSATLTIKSGATTLDILGVGKVGEWIFDGTNWLSATVGVTDSTLNKDNISLGYNAKGYTKGIAIGSNANGWQGIAIGENSTTGAGVAVGSSASAANYGTALGPIANGSQHGVAIGFMASGSTAGASVGRSSSGSNYGAALGSGANGASFSVALGYQAGLSSNGSTIAGTSNAFIGHEAGFDSDITINSNFTSKFILANDDLENYGALIFGDFLNRRVNIGNISEAFMQTTPTSTLNILKNSTDDLISASDATQGDLFVVKNTGRVGIGINNPTKALSVNGEIEAVTVTATTVSAASVNAGSLAVQSGNTGWVIGGFRNTEADGYSGFQLLDNLGATKGFMGFSNSGASLLPNTIFYTSEGAGVPLILAANKIERLRVADTGVGINGNNSTYMFYVNGTAGGTSAYVNASDRRLKKDITTIPNALEKISQIRGVTYNWNHDVHPELVLGHREEMGVIAQEIEKVFPDAVSEDKEKGIKSVAYTMLIAPLIEAVKALNKMVTDIFSTTQKNTREIASVKSELQNKDQEIKKLQRENAEMKARLDRMDKMLINK